jgi:hypothetical protein
MPCYEINLISIQFQVKNRELLEKALDACNLTYWKRHSSNNVIEEIRFRIKLDNGIVEMDRNPETLTLVNKLKREYSIAAIQKAAKMKKWIVKQNGNKMELKRY